jgi:hypothetical protein
MFNGLCSTSTSLIFWALCGAAVVLACYLLQIKGANPYENKRPFHDAKNGNFWARVVVWYTYAFGLLVAGHFGCLIWVVE